MWAPSTLSMPHHLRAQIADRARLSNPALRVPSLLILNKERTTSLLSPFAISLGGATSRQKLEERATTFLRPKISSTGYVFFPRPRRTLGIAKFFTNEQIPYHTYQLPSEKILNMVIRGIPSEIPEDQILRQLCELGYNSDSVGSDATYSGKNLKRPERHL
ncbi:hypothetical protein QE152_g15986 [Popillia japonica]|uniref:Uncharacterized protein n=1 Tax=Popillia japonica TaxID=7064 RepID=A0AAW1L6A7_POPJA